EDQPAELRTNVVISRPAELEGRTDDVARDRDLVGVERCAARIHGVLLRDLGLELDRGLVDRVPARRLPRVVDRNRRLNKLHRFLRQEVEVYPNADASLHAGEEDAGRGGVAGRKAEMEL